MLAMGANLVYIRLIFGDCGGSVIWIFSNPFEKFQFVNTLDYTRVPLCLVEDDSSTLLVRESGS